MRTSLVIVALAAIAVTVVHLRREQTRAQNEIHRLKMRQIHLRRRLYDQQADLGRLLAPRRVLERADRMDVGLVRRAPIPADPPDGERGRSGRLVHRPASGRR